MSNKKLIITLFSFLSFSMSISAGEIHDAAKQGDIAKVKALLVEDSGLVNARDEKGFTPLHSSIDGGQKEIVELLIEKKADINAANNNGVTPLHSAAYQGLKETTELLISKGAKLEARKSNGQTPLINAVLKGNLEVSQLLIDSCADVNSRDNWENTPLHFSAYTGCIEVVKLLLEKGVSINETGQNGNTALHFAVNRDYKEVVSYLMENGADINIPDESGGTVLLLAIDLNKNDMLDILLTKKESIDIEGEKGVTLLHAVASNGCGHVVEFLLSSGVDAFQKNASGNTLLHSLAEGGISDPILKMIDKGLDVDAKNDYGQTPLYNAIQKGDVEIVNLLLENGAKVNVSDLSGRTPLHLAEDWCDKSLCDLLKRHGARDAERVAINIRTNKKEIITNNNLLNITYIANEGFLISSSSKKILIDALFKKRFPQYAAPSPRLVEKIQRGNAPFDNIDLLLITHNHMDHIHAPYVSEFLRNNPKTILLSTPEVYDAIEKSCEKFEEIKEQIIKPSLEMGEVKDTLICGIQIKAIRLWHSHKYPVQNFVFLINLEGKKILHTGDSPIEINQEYLEKLHLEKEMIDMAFLGYYDCDVTASQIKYTKPNLVIPIHIPPRDLKEEMVILMDTFTNVHIFKDAMERKFFK